MVAGMMAIGIVVGLEVIDIGNQQRQRHAVALALTPQRGHLPIEAAPVMQAGQSVAIGQQLHQPGIEEALPRLVLQQVATHRTDHAAGQQKQQVVDQSRQRETHPPLANPVSHDAQQGNQQCLAQAQTSKKVAGHADQQQALVGEVVIHAVGDRHHHRSTNPKGGNAGHAHPLQMLPLATPEQRATAEQYRQHHQAHRAHPPALAAADQQVIEDGKQQPEDCPDSQGNAQQTLGLGELSLAIFALQRATKTQRGKTTQQLVDIGIGADFVQPGLMRGQTDALSERFQ